MAWAPKARRSKQQGDYRKPEYSELYNQHWWKEASKAYRIANPLCVECKANGVTKAAECVDHIEPHRGDLERFRNESNWQVLCNACHARKSRGERGRK